MSFAGGRRAPGPRGSRAILFDMDGLLVDSEPLYKRAWQDSAASLGYDLSDADYATLVGRAEPECELRLGEIFGGGFPLERFRALWKSAWKRSVDDGGLQTKSGAQDLLIALRSAGVPVAVATSSTSYYATLSLAQTGLDVFFEHVVNSEDVARAKPAPDLYLAAAARLGIAPPGCVVLEDSPAGGLSALAAGMQVVFVPDLQAPPPELAARALGVFASLAEATPHVLRAIGVS